MQLTNAEFEEYINRWTSKINWIIKRFQQYGNMQTLVSRDDLRQEALLACYRYLIKRDPDDQIVFPYLNVINAIQKFILQMTPCCMPKSVANFRRSMEIANQIRYESGDSITHMVPDFADSVVTKRDMDLFLESIDPEAQQVALMRMHGDQNQEIAEKLGVPVKTVETAVQRIRRRYRKYSSEE